MTRDAFRRLALMVASSAWLAAVAAAWVYLDWIIAAAAVLGGTVVAAALTVEPTPASRAEVREKVGGLSAREIERKARRASTSTLDG